MSRPEFETHVLNEVGMSRAKIIGNLFTEFLNELESVVPEGRHLSIVKTKLEDACFHAKKGMACNKDNQKE